MSIQATLQPLFSTLAPDTSARAWLGSLRGKSTIALLLLVIYGSLVGLFTNMERKKLLDTVHELEAVHRTEEQLVQINMSMARTLLTVNIAFSAPDPLAAAPPTVIELEATRSLLESLERRHARILMLANKLEALVNDIVHNTTRGVLAVTRNTLHELITELDSVTRRTRNEKLQLLNAYKTTYDRVTLQGLIFSVVGFVALGAAIIVFFKRLSWDIRTLETRASEIVHGYRGTALKVNRHDEVGRLMVAVNRMQDELRERERHIERNRQEKFHREKMAAIGSLAAQLAHEINNPIAAISGVADSILDMRQKHACAHMGRGCQPELILEQTRRISTITRQIADFSHPLPATPQLQDINQLMRNTCAFLSFDQRFRKLKVDTELDSELPAVRIIADRLTQVLLNLLINAADALEHHAPGEGLIEVRTISSNDRVIIQITDNGKGMNARTLEHAFDEYFTTKPNGKGTGLGLTLSRELIREAGGSLTLDSTPGRGTRAVIELPLPASCAPGTVPS